MTPDDFASWEPDCGTFKSDEKKAPESMVEFLARDGRLIEVMPGNPRKWREAWTIEEFLNELIVKAIAVVIKHGITDPHVAIEMALEELSE